MMSTEDATQLHSAAELLNAVIARHRGEDLRAVAIFTEAIREIRIGTRYVEAFRPQARPAA